MSAVYFYILMFNWYLVSVSIAY